MVLRRTASLNLLIIEIGDTSCVCILYEPRVTSLLLVTDIAATLQNPDTATWSIKLEEGIPGRSVRIRAMNEDAPVLSNVGKWKDVSEASVSSSADARGSRWGREFVHFAIKVFHDLKQE